MALNFPASPAVNDEYQYGEFIYVWDGEKWTTKVVLGSGTGGEGGTPPYDGIRDGVVTSSPTENAVYDGLAGKVNKAGDTMTGNLFVATSSEPRIGVQLGEQISYLYSTASTTGLYTRGFPTAVDDYIIYRNLSDGVVVVGGTGNTSIRNPLSGTAQGTSANALTRKDYVDAEIAAIELLPGPQGPAGPKGDTGSTGATGPQGPIGETGETGPQGIQGVAGPTGPQGEVGPEGPQGIQGIQGPAGLDGAEGPAGPQGEAGPQGIQGVAGPKGDTGATGAVGATGPAGPQGEIGPQGPAGAASTVPGPAGPTGPAGPIGETGPQGEQGIQGIPGPTGAAGPKGDTGAQGIQGVAGPAGAKGDKGDKGDPGATGATGPAGPTGPASTVPGPAGPKGDTGAAGATGAQGPKGDKGDPGATGATGAQGPAGPAGPTGPAGPAASNIITSVNGQTGAVVLDAADVGALPVAGGTVTGNLTAPKVLVSAAQGTEINALTRKDYVDNLVANSGGGGAFSTIVDLVASFGIVYTNSYGKPLLITIYTSHRADNHSVECWVGSILASKSWISVNEGGTDGSGLSQTFVVPPGSTWKLIQGFGTSSTLENATGWY